MNITNATTLTGTAVFKNAAYVLAVIATPAYLGLTADSIIVFSIFIVLDVIFGVMKSASLHVWRSIQSSIAQRGILAKMLLVFIPVTTALAGRGVGLDLGFFAQSVINVLILSELYSIIGNIYAIRTGREKSEFDAVAYVLSGMKNVLKSVIVEDAPGPEEK